MAERGGPSIPPTQEEVSATVKKKVDTRTMTTRLQATNNEETIAPVSSTPLVSPSKENLTPNGGMMGIDDEMYITTPLISSAATQLIGNKEPSFPDIKGDMSSTEIVGALDRFDEIIEDINTKFSSEHAADKHLSHRVKRLYARANQTRLIAAEREKDDILFRCTDIMSRIEGLKLKLSIASHNSSENAHTLEGFDTFDFFKAASRLPSSNTHSKIIAELSRKISEMEHVIPAISILTDQVSDFGKQLAGKSTGSTELLQTLSQDLDDLKKRTVILETNNACCRDLLGRVSNLEASLALAKGAIAAQDANIEKIMKSQRQLITESSNHRATVTKDIESLQLCVNALLSNSTTRYCEDPSGNQGNLLTPQEQNDSRRDQRTQDWVTSQNDTGVLRQPRPVVPEPRERPVPQPRQSFRTVDQTGILSERGNGNTEQERVSANSANGTTHDPRVDPENHYRPEQGVSNRFSSNLNGITPVHQQILPNGENEQPAFGRNLLDNYRSEARNDDPVLGDLNSANRRGRQSSCEEDSNSQESSSAAGMYVRGLRRQVNSLGRLLTPRPSETLDKPTLQDIYRNSIPAVNSERKELQHMLQDYMKKRNCDSELIDSIEDVLDQADDWCAKMRFIYHKKGHHKKSQNGKLYEALPKFHPESEIDIFEFTRRFENLTAEYEIPSEQAELFYSKYLSESLQDEVVAVKEDYEKMKSILMHRYGDLKIITDNILAQVSKDRIPGNNDLKAKLCYFRKLHSAFQKIDKLLHNADIPSEETEAFVFSHDFLKRTLHLLPEYAINYYVEAMSNLNQDITRVRGKTAYKTIIACIDKFYERFDAMARNTDQKTTDLQKEKARKPMKNIHHVGVGQDDESNSEDEPEVSYEPNTSKQALFQGKQKVSEKKEKPVLKKGFPCTLTGHKHGIAECAEFFTQTPKERAEQRKNFKYKHCYLCLRSSASCSAKECANIEKVPKELVCTQCYKNSRDKKKACYSVLFCFNEAHTKPSNADIIKALEEYITGFKSSLLNAPISLACHLNILAGTKGRSQTGSLSSSVNPEQSAPVFNTTTGCNESPPDIDKIDEINEDNIGVMQTLSLNGQEVLTLFDRGANQHLISGSLAEQLKIKVINQEQSSVGVVSGNRVWTGYGTYELYLGPTTEGKYYQLKAQGMKEITGIFPKYDLKDVNAETLKCSDMNENTPLPPSVGGDSIKLLIGLKRADLEPTCVFSLPSGIGLYRSPFRDIHGSVYCYGGPHKIFSDINEKFSGNINHFYSYYAQLVNQYRSSPYFSLRSRLEPELIDSGHGVYFEKESCITYSYQSTTGQSFSPSPISEDVIEELGQEVHNVDMDTNICPETHCECPTTNWALKAKIPLVKQKTFLDEADKDDLVNFRCEKCQKCKCASSSTARMMSLTEQIEQEAIEKSVTIDLENKAVYVDLPFTKPPGDFLKAKHGGNNNYKQAHRVYKSQCRLPEPKKESIRKVHADLVEKGFMKKLSELPKEHQELIQESPFHHYMPWRTVSKDSISTPLRLVVDPTLSGLNLILAKGENKIKKMNDIIIRSRTKKFLWSSDISKLYNCLKLKPSSYAYQLFLFSNDLDADTEPDIYVMLVAWYGVSSSSNQAIFALEELARLQRDKYPLAYIVLSEDIFVDDILSGSNEEEERTDQISEVGTVLDSGGFKVKFIILSGEPTDQENVKILGYVWNPLTDILSPGFSELNFNRKKRGLKNPNPFPINNPEDVAKLVSNTDITRRVVISKIAELWEPIGLWEPYKLQLKLASQVLNGCEWDNPLPKDVQQYWGERFQEFLQVPNMQVSRYVFPIQPSQTDHIRLICISDAAANAGGAAIYAGRKLQGNQYSCQLLTSKSKLMTHTIPRNELEAIRIGANLANDVKNALGDAVAEILFFTDSSIAMSWCHNTNKKLRLFVLNRVSEIRRVIVNLTGKTDIPLYHIDGKLNIADLLTKPNTIKPDDLHPGSSWISGYDWMHLQLQMMPIMKFSDLQLSAQQGQQIEEECFPEILLPEESITSAHSFSASKLGKGSLSLVDIIYHGYERSLEIMANVFEFTWTLQHNLHKKRGVDTSQNCKKCIAISTSSGVSTEYRKILISEAKMYFYRLETSTLLKTLPKHKLEKFKMCEGVLYAASRLPEETEISTKDLDFEVFFDNTSISGTLPVVRAESELFFSLLVHIHHKVRKHSGNDITLREITKSVFPIGNPRKIIQEVRRNCPRCRMILKKTLELEMGNHPSSRLQIAPAFYHCMADICYGFKGKPHKNARTTLKIYALVIVCLLTSATSIMALEGLETQDVVLALERHSALHGVPATIFVDRGTQLVSLDKVSLNLRDANHQLRNSLGLEIIPSVAKSHEERGRVERKIRTLRDMLNKTAINTDIALTSLQWETVFSKMASEIDDIPMARADKASNTDIGWQLLTPNRLKLGRSNNRAIEGPMTLSPNVGPVQLLKRVQDIQAYWYQLLLDRLHHLIPKPEKWSNTDEIKLGDVVVLKILDNPNSKLEKWSIAKVSEIQNGGRRIVCSSPHLQPNGSLKMASIIRSPRDICIVSAAEDIPLNSREFFHRILRKT